MKKLLATLLATTMAVSMVGGLTACGGDDEDNSNTITIWAPINAIRGYRDMIDGFKEAYPDYAKFEYKFVAKAESEVQGSMGNNPKSGAEVFFFASDHYGNMRHSNYLTPLTQDYADVATRDAESAVNFVTEDEKIYAFPATNDNGYFLFYDDRKLSDEDVKSLDTIMEKCKTNKWKMHYNYGDSWYSGSFLMGLGCKFGYTDSSMKHYEADLTSPEAYAAGYAMLHYASDAVNKIDNTNYVMTILKDVGAGFSSGSIAAAITYASDYANFKTAFTNSNKASELSHIKATKLPTFKATVAGQEEKEYNMGCFYGAKYCGVNRSKPEKKILASLALANWFTGEEGQRMRFQRDGSGPSNKAVMEDEDVKNNIALIAYKEQMALGDKVNCVQGAQSQAFWGDSGIKTLTNGLFTHNSKGEAQITTQAQVKKALDDLAAALNK